MAIDGVYDVEVSMPEGKRLLEVTLSTKGTILSGTIKGPFGEYSFDDGGVIGDNVSWTVLLTHQSDMSKKYPEKSRKGLFGKIGGFLSDSMGGPPLGTPPEGFFGRISDVLFGSLRESPPETPLAGARKRPLSRFPVRFRAKITGDEISGEMIFGNYATGTLKGSRKRK